MEFTLHQPLVMSSKNAVSVNYPEARLDNPIELDSWQMLSQNICTPYFLTPNFLTSSLPHSQRTQRLLQLFFFLFYFIFFLSYMFCLLTYFFSSSCPHTIILNLNDYTPTPPTTFHDHPHLLSTSPLTLPLFTALATTPLDHATSRHSSLRRTRNPICGSQKHQPHCPKTTQHPRQRNSSLLLQVQRPYLRQDGKG